MESPQEVKENKKALRVFGIESVIIIVLIVVIVAILSYLKVFSLSGIFQNIPGISKPTPTFSPEAKAYFESQRKKQMQEIEQRKPNPNLPKSISIVSDIPSVSASIADEKGLIDLLTSWGVYGRTYTASVYANGSMGNKPLEKVVINLTDEEQEANQYATPDGSVYSSSYAVITPGQMEISIQVDPSKRESLGNQIILQLNKILGRMTSSVNGAKEFNSRDSIINARYDEVRDKSENYFSFN